jgi:ParB-like chromosome segregation protein Spo0J
LITTHPQELVPVGKLKPADYNPREITPDKLKQLKASLKEFGWVEPVVARKEDGLVVGGHQRLLAYTEILRDEHKLPDAKIAKAKIPVVWVEGLSDVKAKVLNLALNKITGEWDYEKLPQVLQSIMDDLPKGEIELSGFTVPEISDILGLVAPAEEQLREIAEEVNVEEGVAKLARQFKFEVADDLEAQLCQQALKEFGMTGPGNAAEAFVLAMQAALSTRSDGNN